ncbi:hypothetical protein TRVA0_029S00342 [Trichomonascus vanleenenianus]|uniref:uncharacterized protein n=1 Tax=Trichomonascus vanleenenianus TaxID=2268995 RepID=UPI003ECB4C89
MKQSPVLNSKDRILLARKQRDQELPSEYLIPADKLPSDDVEDVTNFPYESGLFSDKELEITDSSASNILKNIADRTWSSVETVRAFSKRAAYAHQLVNCLTNMFFERAEARAKELDDYLAKTGKTVGPLHGLPISIKDEHFMEDTYTAIGFSSLAFEKSTINSGTVQLLWDLGAVFYCKTTVPLAMLAVETESALFGVTGNPYNRKVTPGGSSGGESALIAFGGSPIGIGSDIGGSIRVPSSNCGLYGLKPTAYRGFPMNGGRDPTPGQIHILASVGPLAKDLESLEFLIKTVFNSNPQEYDHHMIPLPWKEPELPSKLVFGVLRHDGVVKPVPSVQRAIERAVEAVKKQGHEVIEFEPYDFAKLHEINLKLTVGDGFAYGKALLDGDAIPTTMADVIYCESLTAQAMYALQCERMGIDEAIADQWKKSYMFSKSGRRMDGLISPVAAVPAHPHHDAFYIGYTSAWNTLDYPSVAFPVLRADARIDDKPLRNYWGAFDKAIWEDYDPVHYDGSHVGLQVITRRFEDEKAVRLAGVIRDALNDL